MKADRADDGRFFGVSEVIQGEFLIEDGERSERTVERDEIKWIRVDIAWRFISR